MRSLSVKACTVIDAWGFAYCTTLHTTAPPRFCNYCLDICLVEIRIHIWIWAFALAHCCGFWHLVVSLATTFFLSLMSGYHPIFDLAQFLIYFDVTLRTLPIAGGHRAASGSTLSAVHSVPRWALSFTSFTHSIFASFESSSIMQLCYTEPPIVSRPPPAGLQQSTTLWLCGRIMLRVYQSVWTIGLMVDSAVSGPSPTHFHNLLFSNAGWPHPHFQFPVHSHQLLLSNI